jgi:hypothetical protein
MKYKQCPICGNELEIQDVTPCIECGALEDQVTLLKQNIQEDFNRDSVEFEVYRIFDEFEITLCGFCAIDIGSYDPEFPEFPCVPRISCQNFVPRILLNEKEYGI